MKQPRSAIYWLLVVGSCGVLANCSKENAIKSTDTNSTFVGQECFGWEDGECGDKVCVAGFCRDVCTSDADCNGGICVSNGLAAGCRLPEEGTCSGTKPCPDGLYCGIDKACRTECGAVKPCPIQGQQCIASGCVSPSEPGAKDTWFSCTTGDKRCKGDVVEACNTMAPGWSVLKTCFSPQKCENGDCLMPADAGPDAPEAGPDSSDGGPDAPIEAAVEAALDGPPEADTNTCVSPNQMCGTKCTNTATDPLHCGFCNNECPVPAHSQAVCTTGSCGSSCLAGYDSCDGNPANGCETALSGNDLNCGTCGNKCAYDRLCVGTSCVQNQSLALQVSSGDGFACAVVFDGSVLCWGANDQGQLGAGAGQSRSVPASVQGLSGAVQVSAGFASACARLSSGAISCWGYNNQGQLGNGLTTQSPTPVSVQSVSTAIDVVVSNGTGTTHACAALQDGSVQCWGSNASGELGASTPSFSPTPLPVSGIAGAAQVAAGSSHSCARLSGGQVWCWGAGGSGQLGNGNSSPSPTPVQVSGLSDAAQIAAAGNRTCARRATGAVVCWGDLAILGQGNSASPTTLAGISQAGHVSVGLSSVCVAKSDGSALCAGTNANGELGDGTLLAKTAMTSLKWGGNNAAITGIAATAAGSTHTCVLGTDASVNCTGAGASGSLGDAQLLPGGNRFHLWPVAGFRPARGEQSACDDGADNDLDSFTDALDPDCAADLASNTGSPLNTFTVNPTLANHFKGTCGGDGREKLYHWVAPSPGTFEFATTGSSSDTVLYLRDGAADGVELGCNNDVGGGNYTSKLQQTVTTGQHLVIFVDTATLAGTGTAAIGIKKL